MTRVCRLVRVAKVIVWQQYKGLECGDQAPKINTRCHRDLAQYYQDPLCPSPLYKLQDKTCRRHWCLEVLTWSTRWPLICQFTLSREHRSVKTRYQVPEVMPKDRIRRGRFRRRPYPKQRRTRRRFAQSKQRRWLLAREVSVPVVYSSFQTNLSLLFAMSMCIH